MSELKYGYAYGGHKGVEVPVAANQYFHRQGGHFVIASAVTGYVELAPVTATHLYGYAEVPKDADGYSCWKSSSTAGADKVFVITDPTAVYAMPVATATSVIQALTGDFVDLEQGGSTYTIKQQVNEAAASTKVLLVEKVDADNTIVYVKVNPARLGR